MKKRHGFDGKNPDAVIRFKDPISNNHSHIDPTHDPHRQQKRFPEFTPTVFFPTESVVDYASSLFLIPDIMPKEK
ncbi:MAG: hypothetical protein AB1585_12865, partial [Thermodesulfobacteriota bacterium]